MNVIYGAAKIQKKPDAGDIVALCFRKKMCTFAAYKKSNDNEHRKTIHT